VRLSLFDEAAVAVAWRDLAARIGPRTLVAPMVCAPGVEMLLGMFRDAQFGPVVVLGFGGVHVEALADVVYALPPFDAAEARRLLDRLRLRALLELRVLAALGLCPELRRCVRCGRDVDLGATSCAVAFHVAEGGPLCPRCVHPTDAVLPLQRGTLRALEQGLRLPFDRLDRLALGAQPTAEAQALLARFLRFHVGFELKSERFLDSFLAAERTRASA